MIAVEHGHEHRRIQKTVHSALPGFDRSRSARSCWSTSSVAEAGRGCPERNTQTPCSFVSGPAPHGAERDPFTRTLNLQSVAGRQVQLFAERLRNDHAARFVDYKACIHSGRLLWVDPSVNPLYLRIDPPRPFFIPWQLRLGEYATPEERSLRCSGLRVVLRYLVRCRRGPGPPVHPCTIVGLRATPKPVSVSGSRRFSTQSASSS